MSELSQDFKKLYSKYMVARSASAVMKEMTALAELGDYSAISFFYVHTDKPENENVSRHIEALRKIEDRDWTEDQSNAVGEYYKRMHESKQVAKYLEKCQGRLYSNLLEEMYDLNCYKYKLNAFYLHNNCGKAYTIEDMQRAIDITSEVPYYQFDKKKYDKGIKKLYRKNKKSPEAKFYYAKNLMTNPENKKAVEKAQRLFAEISKEPLSQELAEKLVEVEEKRIQELFKQNEKTQTTSQEKVKEERIIEKMIEPKKEEKTPTIIQKAIDRNDTLEM